MGDKKKYFYLLPRDVCVPLQNLCVLSFFHPSFFLLYLFSPIFTHLSPIFFTQLSFPSQSFFNHFYFSTHLFIHLFFHPSFFSPIFSHPFIFSPSCFLPIFSPQYFFYPPIFAFPIFFSPIYIFLPMSP